MINIWFTSRLQMKGRTVWRGHKLTSEFLTIYSACKYWVYFSEALLEDYESTTPQIDTRIS